jgi:hypothetical protein
MERLLDKTESSFKTALSKACFFLNKNTLANPIAKHIERVDSAEPITPEIIKNKTKEIEEIFYKTNSQRRQRNAEPDLSPQQVLKYFIDSHKEVIDKLGRLFSQGTDPALLSGTDVIRVSATVHSAEHVFSERDPTKWAEAGKLHIREYITRLLLEAVDRKALLEKDWKGKTKKIVLKGELSELADAFRKLQKGVWEGKEEK